MRELQARALSAAVIVPAAIVLIWTGGWVLDLLLLAAVLVMLYEWHRLVQGFARRERLIALLLGAGVITVSALSAHALRAAPYGLDLLAWLVLLVAATDVGAYAAGRSIGGPKLAPRISPKKTWAGFFGGLAAAVAVTVICALWAGRLTAEPLIVAAGLSVVAQIGDLLESWCKRRAAIKDSGHLIPGHGGALDRLDGFLTAAPALWIYHVGFGGGLRLDLPPGPF